METFQLIELFVKEQVSEESTGCEELREFTIEGNFLKVLYANRYHECTRKEFLFLDYITWIYNQKQIK